MRSLEPPACCSPRAPPESRRRSPPWPPPPARPTVPCRTWPAPSSPPSPPATPVVTAPDRSATMTSDERHRRMDAARVRAELTVRELWLRYVALGGTGDAFD